MAPSRSAQATSNQYLFDLMLMVHTFYKNIETQKDLEFKNILRMVQESSFIKAYSSWLFQLQCCFQINFCIIDTILIILLHSCYAIAFIIFYIFIKRFYTDVRNYKRFECITLSFRTSYTFYI